MGYSPWGHKELNMIEGLTLSLSQVPNITAKMSIKKKYSYKEPGKQFKGEEKIKWHKQWDVGFMWKGL